jgi:hypothetical protein
MANYTQQIEHFLQSTRFPHAVIARAVGCSREMVRLVDRDRFHRSGRERRKQMPVEPPVIKPNAVTRQAMAAALERGFAVSCQGANRITVGGWAVTVHVASVPFTPPGSKHDGYLRANISRRKGVDFIVVVGDVPGVDKQETFIIPSSEIPTSGFLYIPTAERPIYNNRKPKHVWRQYLGAWDQFAKEKSDAGTDTSGV